MAKIKAVLEYVNNPLLSPAERVLAEWIKDQGGGEVRIIMRDELSIIIEPAPEGGDPEALGRVFRPDQLDLLTGETWADGLVETFKTYYKDHGGE